MIPVTRLGMGLLPIIFQKFFSLHFKESGSEATLERPCILECLYLMLILINLDLG